MELLTKRLTIRSPVIEDAEELRGKINDFSIVQWLSNTPYPYDIDDAISFINRSNQAIKDSTAYNLVIEIEGEIAGGVGLFDVNEVGGELGFWIASKFWKRGIATEASKTMLYFGFRQLELKTIKASFKEGNEASNKVLKKLGFISVGQKLEDDEILKQKVMMHFLEIKSSDYLFNN